MTDQFEYDVALTFAGEDRAYAHQLATLLKERSVRVFYDKDLQFDLWGKDLYEFLFDVYKRKAMFCVMFVSDAYAKKHWTKHERRAAQERAFSSIREYILPILLDNTEVPGLPTTTAHVSIAEGIPRIAELLELKLAQHGRAPDVRQRRTQRAQEVKGQLATVHAADPILRSVFEWERYFDLDEWEHWVSALYLGELADKHWQGLAEFPRWLPRKIWLDEHRPIALALDNLSLVAVDLIQVLAPYFFHDDDRWVVDKFYRHYEKDARLRDEAVKQFGAYELTIAALAEHLTASANLVLERIRSEVDEMYRFSEGNLVIQTTMGEMEAVQYDGASKRRLQPYPGLKEVLKVTKWKRDPDKWARRR